MKFFKSFILFIMTVLLLTNLVCAQEKQQCLIVAPTGSNDLNDYLSEFRNLLNNLGFDVRLANRPITVSALQGVKALCFIHLGQCYTGNDLQTISESEADVIHSFVKNGGGLFITSRRYIYTNLFSRIGVTASGGGDGGSSGFDWPLTMKSATFFIQHPVTQGITRLHGDCGANFSVDQNWRVIGREQRDGTPLLSVRELGNGRIVLWYAQRSFRNPGGSGNVYESDIGREQNRQFFRNAFTWLKNSPNTIVERGAFPYDGILVQTPYGSEFYASSRGVTRDCGRNISACEAVPDILPDYHKVLEVNEPLEIFKSFSRKDVGTRQDITYPLTVKFDESMIKEIKPPDLSTSVFTVASPDVYIIEIKGQTYSVKDKDWYSSHVGSLTQWGVHCPNETAPCYLYGTYENGKWAALTNVRPPSTSQIYVEVEGPARMFYDISRSYEQRGDYTSAVAWRAAGTIIQVLYEYYRAR